MAFTREEILEEIAEAQTLPLSRREWISMAHLLRQRDYKPHDTEGQREAAAERMRRFRAKNKAHVNAKARAQRAARPEVNRAACRRWYHRTKEERAAYLKAKDLARTRKRQLRKLVFCCLILARVAQRPALQRRYAEWCAAMVFHETQHRRSKFSRWYRRHRRHKE